MDLNEIPPLVLDQPATRPAFREGFTFTVPESPKKLFPDLTHYSFGAGDHAGTIRQPPADIGRKLVLLCRQSQWDAVEEVVTSFERLVKGAVGNAEIVRTALNYQDEVSENLLFGGKFC